MGPIPPSRAGSSPISTSRGQDRDNHQIRLAITPSVVCDASKGISQDAIQVYFPESVRDTSHRTQSGVELSPIEVRVEFRAPRMMRNSSSPAICSRARSTCIRHRRRSRPYHREGHRAHLRRRPRSRAGLAIPRCIAWKIAGGSRPIGVRVKTTARPGITASPPPALATSRWKPAAGAESRAPSRLSRGKTLMREAQNEPAPILPPPSLRY
jgi:hypothetical protein